MPVNEKERRKQQYQQLVDQHDQLDKELRDYDWIERIASNEDFKKLCELYLKENEAKDPELKEMEEVLLNHPLTPDRLVKLKEMVMLMKRDKINVTGFISFPQREIARLAEGRKLMPDLKTQIDRLKKQEESSHG